MDGTLALGQCQANASAALSRLSPEKLLLLGLQLLTKNSAAKVPCAVVQPRLQKSESNHQGSPQSPKSSPQASPPSSPEQQQVPTSSGSRKRRRGDNTELSNEEKREKRLERNLQIFYFRSTKVHLYFPHNFQEIDEQSGSTECQRQEERLCR